MALIRTAGAAGVDLSTATITFDRESAINYATTISIDNLTSGKKYILSNRGAGSSLSDATLSITDGTIVNTSNIDDGGDVLIVFTASATTVTITSSKANFFYNYLLFEIE